MAVEITFEVQNAVCRFSCLSILLLLLLLALFVFASAISNALEIEHVQPIRLSYHLACSLILCEFMAIFLNSSLYLSLSLSLSLSLCVCVCVCHFLSFSLSLSLSLSVSLSLSLCVNLSASLFLHVYTYRDLRKHGDLLPLTFTYCTSSVGSIC